MRALIAAVIVLAAWSAEAQTRRPWNVDVAPPRAALPSVTVDLGYPGPYVPWESAPITLHATAGDMPFDGYIGFHFRANERVTYDTPVISRAVLRPHEQWTFTTFARIRIFGVSTRSDGGPASRELIIEWRDRATRVIAVQNAGVPPWTFWSEERMPLRVERGDALSDRAQWYAGFSEVIVPLDVWLDLPRRVREAIFGSGIHVAFSGTARADQKLDALDRALLSARSTTATPPHPRPTRRDSIPWPHPSQIVRLYPALLTSLAAVIVTVAGWILVRRRQRARFLVALLAFAAIALAVRKEIRPAAGTYRVEVQVPVVPGIVDTLEIRRTYGPSPLAEPPGDLERMRTSVTGALDRWPQLEVRTSDTPMGMGLISSRQDWDAITRWARRRELGGGPRIHIRQRDANKIVLDYDSSFPVNYVYAEWRCGATNCAGDRPVRRGTSGTVTIDATHERWKEDEPFVSDVPALVPILLPPGAFGRAEVVLAEKRASSRRDVHWFETGETKP